MTTLRGASNDHPFTITLPLTIRAAPETANRLYASINCHDGAPSPVARCSVMADCAMRLLNVTPLDNRSSLDSTEPSPTDAFLVMVPSGAIVAAVCGFGVISRPCARDAPAF